MLKRAYLRLTEEQEWLPVALLLVLGCVLRLSGLGSFPYGLNQDEASAGYETFALLRSGSDRNGDPWPVLFTAWGSGQNVLMSYLAIPFVALLGLTETAVRLPNAIAGCLTLPVFWRLARNCRGKRFALTALALLAVNPWHVMMSRWGLESNLLPFLLLTGVWLTSISRERPWALVGAAAAFGLSLYAYGAAFFFLPLFLVCAVLWLRRELRPAPFCTALALFLVLAFPIALCQLRNALGMEPARISWFTLPKLTEGRQTATSVFGGAGAAENFRDFLRILWTQSDGLPWNSMPLWKGGIYYFFGLPTAFLGFVASLFRRKDVAEETPVRLWLLCCLVCAFLIRVNINRINMVWLPLVYFSALGVHLLLARLDGWAALPAAGIASCFLLFLSAYAAAFGDRGNVNFFPGLGDAVRFADHLDAEIVYITDYVNQPYIFALFYTETPPEEFAATVAYRNPDAAFRQVERFAGFEFRDRARADALVLYRSETSGYTVLAEFGNFAVCVRGEI